MKTDETSWEVELRSIDLAELRPIFPDADRARDAGIILDEARTHRRLGRHETLDATRIARARDALERLPELGESVHILLHGAFRNSDFIPVILDLARCPCDRLTISTLGYDKTTGELLLRELDRGRIRHLSLTASVYFRAHEAQLWVWLVSELERRGSRALACRTHAKTMAFDFEDGRRFALESSANLRSCRMMELTVITQDPGLARFHHDWVSELFERAKK